MKKSKKTFWTMLGTTLALFVVLAGVLFSAHPAYALPEYAQRTGQSCSTCHVNPGGGGPRTMRGLIWSSNGKPDEVPDLPGVLIAPGVDDGEELYQIACSGCHGVHAEGMFGVKLFNSGVQEKKIRSTILRGRLKSGMPSFADKFTNDQLEMLISFVDDITSGSVEFTSATIPLEKPAFEDAAQYQFSSPGGN